ncbi:MAG: histidine phosphatase family protein [Negativicutes bacterium]|nr:histidine phosphatase family protein [Negativicutes bacterium]
MTKVILVRHGQTLANKEGKYQGHTDAPLSWEGMRQAELAAARLAGEELAAVYASDLRRAFVTARIIARRHCLPVAGLAELREINFGQWEGLTYDAIFASWPKEIKQLYGGDTEAEIPGGESFRQLQKRAVGAVNMLVARHPEETIAIVSHGGTIRTIIADVLGMPLSRLWHIRQDHVAINGIDYHHGFAVVYILNDTYHVLNENFWQREIM